MDEPLDLSVPKLLKLESNFNEKKCLKYGKSFLCCEFCKKVFDRPSLLKRHRRTHTGEKPHICETCNKGFSTSSSLNTHRRIHSGLKPHICNQCGKCFTASSNLYYHKMTHSKICSNCYNLKLQLTNCGLKKCGSQVKPHKCSICPKSFPTPGDLRSHMYIHNGSWPFRCHICFRGFSKQTNLKNHFVLHSGDRKYICAICGKRFALSCNLKTHMKLHYSESYARNHETKSYIHNSLEPKEDNPNVCTGAIDFFRQNMYQTYLNFNVPLPYQQKLVIQVEEQTVTP